MKRRFGIRGWLSLAVLAGAASVGLAQTAPDDGVDWLRPRVVQFAKAGERVEALKIKTRGIFIASDLDGGGVSKSDYELFELKQVAQQRAAHISQWAVLDLDGDGKVTRTEIERSKVSQAIQSFRTQGVVIMPTDEQLGEVLAKLVHDVLVDDLDGDGTITLAEVVESHRRKQTQAAFASGRMMLVPLSLDRSGDGIVSREEFDAAVALIIAGIDSNGDGVVSDAELEAAKARVRAESGAQQAREQMRREADSARKLAEACAYPKPAADAKIILVGAYEGEALSNIALGDDDVETMVAQIVVERGDVPLYIVATSYASMLWQITGATDRVAMFAASSVATTADKKPRVGVVGLARERVFVASQPQCIMHFSDAKAGDGIRAKGQVLAMVGRPPDDVVAAYALSKVGLPSGIISPGAAYPNALQLPAASNGPGSSMWRELLRFQPGGVAVNDPGRVVSLLPVRAYEVLPREAGLAQLMDAGAIEGVGRNQVIDFGGLRSIGTGTVRGGEGGTTYSMPAELRILKKIRFPAGLAGAHSVRFILGRGVPMPDGHPGHSTLISEETGQKLLGTP